MKLMHWSRALIRSRLAPLLGLALLLLPLLTACDVFDSIPRPPERVHMYGDAVNRDTFQPLANAKIVITLDGQAHQYTGSYDIMMPVGDPFVVDVTCPGYLPYHVQATLDPMGSDELRSPLRLQPA
jgi:hypothetical protein